MLRARLEFDGNAGPRRHLFPDSGFVNSVRHKMYAAFIGLTGVLQRKGSGRKRFNGLA